ncbi:pyruvate kinase [Rhodospirillaceae bacterium KN72]|uniref:Pyruvate kinase n=1 Tax=Pacificispira spongiicola TaxID=2729598 RepID=A0A7Y0HG33_9PROT|nr:pyruvate kinase [Pacificispira spongiicola]NMM45233.1 pyruvate kinase [Pacificispira spongiicola]
MRRQHRTKIVATLGPGTATAEAIESLFDAGVDVFRLNFSHGAHEEHKARLDAIRDLERRSARPIAVMLDLQGPKLRIGVFKDGPIELAEGDKFRLDLDKAPGDQHRVTLPHPEIFQALDAGSDLLLDDGRIKLTVEGCGSDHANCVVAVGGPLSERKGVNVPGVLLPLSPLTEKDRADLEYGLTLGVDWVALSFVQRPEDIVEARALIQGKAGIMAKLEKPSAIAALEEIVQEADAVMVARGDLGVEMPPEDVPVLQRRIIHCCRTAGKPVVVATQMLDSMVERPVPTRAEASDVATAVYSGADAVMLSAETAVGDYPVEAVDMMNRIIERVERDPVYREGIEAQKQRPEPTTADAVAMAAAQVASTLNVNAIATYTTSGSTTLRIARERPVAPILGLTPRDDTARRLAVVWGVHPARVPDAKDLDDMSSTATHQAKIDGFGKDGDRIVITAGVPFSTPGKTNLLRIARIGGATETG